MAAPNDSLAGLQRAMRGCLESEETPSSKTGIVSSHTMLGYAESFTRDLGVDEVESTNSLLEEVSGRLDAHLDRNPVHDLSQKKISFDADMACNDVVQAVMGRLPALEQIYQEVIFSFQFLDSLFNSLFSVGGGRKSKRKSPTTSSSPDASDAHPYPTTPSSPSISAPWAIPPPATPPI